MLNVLQRSEQVVRSWAREWRVVMILRHLDPALSAYSDLPGPLGRRLSTVSWVARHPPWNLVNDVKRVPQHRLQNASLCQTFVHHVQWFIVSGVLCTVGSPTECDDRGNPGCI